VVWKIGAENPDYLSVLGFLPAQQKNLPFFLLWH